MGNFTIPNRPAAGDQRDITLIEADFDAVLSDMDSIAGSRRLVGELVVAIPPGSGQQSVYVTPTGTLVSAPANGGFRFWYLDPAEFAVVSKTAQITLRGALACNAVSIGACTITAQLYQLAVAGSGGVTISIAGGAVGNSVSFAAVPTSAVTSLDSTPSAFPVAGPYIPVITIGGAAVPANCSLVLALQLFAICV